MIADRDHPGDLRTTITELVRDYLAIGLDPDDTVVFPHSAIPALNQLLLPFLSLVSMGELQRNPTVKDEIRYAGRAHGQRADAHLSGAPGRGHPVLQGRTRAGRTRISCRTSS